jgi:hypothetical protein
VPGTDDAWIRDRHIALAKSVEDVVIAAQQLRQRSTFVGMGGQAFDLNTFNSLS